jgi:NAD(P)-dependent dehydrogenase (short-subunit alcohol dehydrogenase family)
MSYVLVTGAGAGLGKELAFILAEEGHVVTPFDRKLGHDVRDPYGSYGPCPEPLDVLINCAAVNITGWLQDVSEKDWDEVLDINTKGIYLMSQWALRSLSLRKGTIINIISNAAHIPMTCSIAYNASKGAAHIMTLQMARELTKKHGITVFGIAPNKMAGTEMSQDIERQVVAQRGWAPEHARQYQLAALLPGEETPPARVAELIAFLLSERDRHRFLTGTVIPYGA